MDRITVEILKPEVIFIPQLVTTIFNNLCKKEQYPDAFNFCLVTKLPEKEQFEKCDHQHRIILMTLQAELENNL